MMLGQMVSLDIVYQDLKDMKRLLKKLNHALEVEDEEKDIAHIHSLLGWSYRQLEDYDKALDDKVNKVNNVISKITNPDNKKIPAIQYAGTSLYCRYTQPIWR